MNQNEFYPAFPGGKFKAFTVSYDDGNTCDDKLVELLRKYHAKGTFNINSQRFNSEVDAPPPARWRHMTVEETLQLYGDDMEIAVHGCKHPFWTRMSSVNAMQDILDDKRELERLTGRIIRGAAYPYGTFTDDVVQTLRLADFAYCRTTIATKKLTMKLDDPLRFSPTVHHKHPETLELARKFADKPYIPGAPFLFYLWGHSYEFLQDDNWDLFEEILKIVCDREDVWYCTNLELFDYWTAVQSLHWNVEGDTVYNPTATDIWLRRTVGYYCKTPEFFCIPAGKTVKM